MKNKYLLISGLSILLLLCSCDSDLFDNTPLSVTPTSVSLYVDGTQQLSVNKTRNITYTPTDYWYVDISTNGLITAKKRGNTSIKVSDGNSSVYVSVEVKSAYELYPDMDYYIGKQFSVFNGAFGNYDETTTTDDYITYWYDHRTKYDISFGFIFKKGDGLGIIQAVSIYVPGTYENQLETYLWDRYFCEEALNDVYYFYNHNKDVALKLENKSNLRMFNVLYYPLE